MAKAAKKDPALTPEEKLVQALVPESEQPYRIPENWRWTRIDDLIEILNGFAFKSEKYVDSGIRIIRIANVQDGYIEDEKPVFYPINSLNEIKKYILKDKDLLISLTGNVGRVAFMEASFLPAALNQRVGCLRLRDKSPLSIKFLFYYFLRREFQERCMENSKGSAQLNMSTEWLYPMDKETGWTSDNYGPLWIPKKGETITLTLDNLPFYSRPIQAYENNTLDVRDGKIFINGQETAEYTFKMDYYWMMGDNRHNSADSRSWGFVPEDHIVGKPVFIWLSLDPDRGWLNGKIRWNRLFTFVDKYK